MRTLWPLLLVFLIPLMGVQNSYALYCFESLPDGTSQHNLCGFASGNVTQVFSASNQPIEQVQPGFAYVILWGGILGIIWFKTERIDILGIIGIMIAGTITGLSPNAVGIGFTLLFISLGILLFQVIRQRITVYT